MSGIPVRHEGAQMFAVLMKERCDHLATIKKLSEEELAQINFSKPCEMCQDPSENWICMTCLALHCGRHVSGHGVDHFNDNPTHAFAMSTTDLSCWCYACGDYVDNAFMLPLRNAIHLKKFGEDIPRSESVQTAGPSRT